MWFSLAVKTGEDPDFIVGQDALDSLTHEMTPEQIAEAKRLAAKWKPSPAQPPAPAEARGSKPGTK